MSGKLARVDWQLGQTLLPAHFTAQEDALLTELALRLKLTGKPLYGVMQLKFDESNLLINVIRVEKFSCILETGELIQQGANADFADPSDRLLFPQDIASVALFIEIKTCSLKGHDVHDDKMNNECESSCRPVSKKGYQLRLVSIPASKEIRPQIQAQENEETMVSTIELFKIADFNKGADNHWFLSEHFVPPCLYLSSVPYFNRRKHTIQVFLDDFELDLRARFSSVSKGEQSNVKVGSSVGSALGSVLSQLSGCQHLLYYIYNSASEIIIHPFDLFIGLQKLYFEICLYRNKLPEQHLTHYQHKNLSGIFDELIGLLRQVIYLEEFGYYCAALKEKDGIYSTEIKHMETAMVFYLAVHHENQTMLNAFSETARASSRERVPVLHQQNLEGVEFSEVTDEAIKARIDKRLSLDEPARYFEILKKDEWQFVVDHLSFGFYGQNSYRDFRFFLVSETKQYAFNG